LLGSMLRTIDLLMKLRRHADAGGPRPPGPAPDLAASPVGPEPCEKIRNEPNAPMKGAELGARHAREKRPAPAGSPLAPAPAPGANPARILDATPEASIDCEKLRNEPTAAGPTERLLPARPDPIHVGRAFQPDTDPIRPTRPGPSQAGKPTYGRADPVGR